MLTNKWFIFWIGTIALATVRMVTADSNSGLQAALSSCSSTVAKDSSGRPNQTAFDACMTAKGYTKPSGTPSGMPSGRPGGGHHR